MPRKFKLTWQPGSGNRPGRWKKKYKGKSYYFSAGRGKSDRDAYEAAWAAWEKKKLRIDAALPKPHQAEYERAIREWESVLTWCRKHPGEEQMADTALAKLQRLRNRFAASKPKPITREDTFEGQFDRADWPPGLTEAIEALDREPEPPDWVQQLPGYEKYMAATREFMENAEGSVPGFSQVIDPREFAFLQGPFNLLQDRFRIWQDRLDVMHRSAESEDQMVRTYSEQFLEEKTAAVAAGELSAGRNYLLRLHVTHFRDWIGSETNVVDINGKHLNGYRVALLADVDAKKWTRTTASDRLKSVKSFIRWLWQIEAIPTLPRIMDGKSKALTISENSPTVVVYTKQEIATLLQEAIDRTKLHILLMLNCGMTQKDISDLDLAEVDWEAGRITRRRSKTRGFDNVPLVSYRLWPETLRLLRQARSNKRSGRVLLNERGRPLCYEEAGDNGKLKKIDSVRSAYHRLRQKTGINKPLKSLKKTSASLLRNSQKYASLEDLFLGHAPRRMSDKHYTLAPQTLFDEAIAWLGTEFEVSATSTSGKQS
ncbi:MAG: tyrosine-type recombinase/integrase [Planctomycetes bacterium]|nr:tyrosine-type recombinase/integrase [Planctomycetota bacterium]MBL7043522.1 tyrosine-type recombinase/integrase [Pirellulaceae bacterium]